MTFKNLLHAVLLFSVPAFGQEYKSTFSKVSFFSKAAVEDIAASNVKGASMFNTETGEIAFSIPVSEFKFAKKLMKEHFNEKYLETEKFPLSTFEGKLTGYLMSATGAQYVKAEGKLVLHGVEKEISVPGTMEILGKQTVMKAKFKVKLIDYKIPRPQVLWQNIAEEIEVTLEFNYESNEN